MDLDKAAAGFAAMGAGHRLTVLRLLVKAGEAGLQVSEIAARTGMAASTLAHHLKALSSAGLITQEAQGRSTINRADYRHLEALAGYILQECCLDMTATGDTENG